jgi:Protein of unknown function (DUF4240)
MRIVERPGSPRAARVGRIEPPDPEARDRLTAQELQIAQLAAAGLTNRDIGARRFQQIRRQMDERAYTWDIWGAAFVIVDGCSDDCFRDFRAYLISLGSRAFAAALRYPDSLAPIVQDVEEGDRENVDDVAPDAYETATGDGFPADSSDLSGSPGRAGTTSPRRRSRSATPRWRHASAEPTPGRSFRSVERLAVVWPAHGSR